MSSISVSEINTMDRCCNNNNLLPGEGINIIPNPNGTITVAINTTFIIPGAGVEITQNTNGTITIGFNETYLSELITETCCNNSNSSSGGIDSIVPGTGILVDNTDPQNPIVSTSAVLSVEPGTAIAVDATDPQHPIVSSTANLTDLFTTVTVNLTADMLAGKALVPIFNATASKVYVCDALYSITSLGTDFSGGGGDCQLNIYSSSFSSPVPQSSSSALSFGAGVLQSITAQSEEFESPGAITSSIFFFTVEPGGTVFAEYSNRFTCVDYAVGAVVIQMRLLDVSSAYYA
jgi:hypothetical protein